MKIILLLIKENDQSGYLYVTDTTNNIPVFSLQDTNNKLINNLDTKEELL